MIKFDDNELGIAIITYNRPDFIKEWLYNCYEEAYNRNISVSIFDSSPNTKTKEVVEAFRKEKNCSIEYLELDPDTVLGYKPMIPLFTLNKKYVWICGDSRRHDFHELDENVFPYLKDDYDYILFLANNRQKPKSYSINNLNEFINECFVSSTCIGFSIYKTSIFNYLKMNILLKNEYDCKFKNNYGFGWLGYFYNAFTKGEYRARTCRVRTIDILSKKKKQVWAKRFYECWIDNLCQIIDNIPDIYSRKNDVPRIVWDELKLYSDQYCYLARKNGDLNVDTFERYNKEGKLNRITSHKNKISFYAKAPMIFVEIKYLSFRLSNFIKKIILKCIKIIRGDKI